MAADQQLPDAARIVIIGGGVGGASVAYHLSALGERDVLLVERDELTSGSTFHSAGLVGQLRADPALTRMNMYSVELYRKLQAGEHAVAWTECGGIKLASSSERLQEIRRQISWARTYGLPLGEISVREAAELFPLISTDGVVGAAYLPSDGCIDPSQLCNALANLARAGGVRIAPRTRVVGIDVEDGRIRRVHTDKGEIACEIVVNCGGMFAAEIGRMAGVRIPLIPMSHQYLVTEAFLPERGDPLPTLRDPDLLVYFRQEVNGLVMGGYERDPEAWTATVGSYDAVPADFNGRLLPENWPRFEQIAQNSQIRVPDMADIGVRMIVNGPEAFTPDNEFCLGETEVGGFFVAAGFCAHGIAGAGGIGKIVAEWIVEGQPSLDVWHMDISRFGRDYRSPRRTLARTLESYRTYTTSPIRDGSGSRGAHCARRPPTRGTRRTAPSSARRRAGSASTTTKRTPRAATALGGRTAGPDGTGRRRSPPSTSRPEPWPACSTRRRSPRSTSAARMPRRCSNGYATTGWFAVSATSPTRRR